MKRLILIIGILIVLIILVLIKIITDSGKKNEGNATVANSAIPVECMVVRDTSVTFRITTIGTIRANESVEIVSEINRKVTGIFLKEGSFVEKGQLLFKLDDADIVARINKLMLEEKLAATNEARERALLAKGGISQERYDEVANRMNTLLAEIEVLKVDLAKTSICAPFSGKIGLRNVSEGALVTPNTVLATLQDISRVKVDFAIPERFAGDVKPGAVVNFSADYSIHPFPAKVEAIEPAVDLKTRTIQLRAFSDNTSGDQIPGTSVKVLVDLKGLTKSVFVPTAALIPSIKGYLVFVARNGTALPMMVKTGQRNRESVQVLEGLSAGDTLVLTNLLRVKKDASLKLIKIH